MRQPDLGQPQVELYLQVARGQGCGKGRSFFQQLKRLVQVAAAAASARFAGLGALLDVAIGLRLGQTAPEPRFRFSPLFFRQRTSARVVQILQRQAQVQSLGQRQGR